MSQRYTDKIVQQADRALEALGAEFVENAPSSGSSVLEIEFAAREVPSSELPEFRPGTIIDFDEPAQPVVSLYYEGRRVAEGILMVQDGAIAVKITQKWDRPDQ